MSVACPAGKPTIIFTTLPEPVVCAKTKGLRSALEAATNTVRLEKSEVFTAHPQK
jgi:hypothetical protein